MNECCRDSAHTHTHTLQQPDTHTLTFTQNSIELTHTLEHAKAQTVTHTHTRSDRADFHIKCARVLCADRSGRKIQNNKRGSQHRDRTRLRPNASVGCENECTPLTTCPPPCQCKGDGRNATGPTHRRGDQHAHTERERARRCVRFDVCVRV